MSDSSSISSSLGASSTANTTSSSLALSRMQMKQSAVNTLLSGFNTGATSSILASLQSGQEDLLEISAVGGTVQDIAKIAASSETDGMSEAMSGVRAFAADLQKQGTGTTSILLYLNKAKEMAESDPEGFVKLFAGTKDADNTGTKETDSVTNATDVADETVTE